MREKEGAVSQGGVGRACGGPWGNKERQKKTSGWLRAHERLLKIEGCTVATQSVRMHQDQRSHILCFSKRLWKLTHVCLAGEKKEAALTLDCTETWADGGRRA